MRAQITQGRFVEFPTEGATGMDRRAFGEFVGPQGELASYALGWVTGQEQHVGWISIGVGAGNPGGATIHAVVFDNGDKYAFSLVDEPFEEVPEGGPHLTAEQARAHEALPFMWWVADHVFAQDHRAWWLLHWLLGTRCIQTTQVFDRSEPILYVRHDDDDESWQLIGSSDAGTDGKVGHLSHAIDEDPTLVDILNLKPGESATRSAPDAPWMRKNIL